MGGVRLFGKWDAQDVEVKDISLTDYISLRNAVYTPHTAGRYASKQFKKAQMPIVERLVNRWASDDERRRPDGKVEEDGRSQVGIESSKIKIPDWVGMNCSLGKKKSNRENAGWVDWEDSRDRLGGWNSRWKDSEESLYISFQLDPKNCFQLSIQFFKILGQIQPRKRALQMILQHLQLTFLNSNLPLLLL